MRYSASLPPFGARATAVWRSLLVVPSHLDGREEKAISQGVGQGCVAQGFRAAVVASRAASYEVTDVSADRPRPPRSADLPEDNEQEVTTVYGGSVLDFWGSWIITARG